MLATLVRTAADRARRTRASHCVYWHGGKWRCEPGAPPRFVRTWYRASPGGDVLACTHARSRVIARAQDDGWLELIDGLASP